MPVKYSFCKVGPYINVEMRLLIKYMTIAHQCRAVTVTLFLVRFWSVFGKTTYHMCMATILWMTIRTCVGASWGFEPAILWLVVQCSTTGLS